MQTFGSYLRVIAERFPFKKDLAEAIGVSSSRLSHAIKGSGGYTFSMENCLRLAKIADRPAVEVLRVARKVEMADLLEHLFPRAGKPGISGAQRELLDEWAQLSEPEQRAFKLLIHERVASRAKEQQA